MSVKLSMVDLPERQENDKAIAWWRNIESFYESFKKTYKCFLLTISVKSTKYLMIILP